MIITTFVFNNIALALAFAIPALCVAAAFLWALGRMENMLCALPDPIAVTLFALVMLTGLLVAADAGYASALAYAEWRGIAQ